MLKSEISKAEWDKYSLFCLLFVIFSLGLIYYTGAISLTAACVMAVVLVSACTNEASAEDRRCGHVSGGDL